MSEIYINTITEVDTSQETPVETTYKIEAQRLSQGNVGDSKHPVYFENGIPVQCESGSGGGGGGSDVVITPNSYIASLNRSEKEEIATFKIGDEDTQSLYIPRYSSGYIKQTLFSGQLGETTGDGGAPLAQPFTNYEYLYIHVEDTRNLIGSHVVTVPTNSLKMKLMSDQALVSCNLYGTLGMVIRFTSTTGFKVEYINNLPNGSTPASEDNQISVVLTKIEGVTLGISKGSWGQNTREAIWIGTASTVDPTEKYYFKEEDEETHELAKLRNYDFIYVYGHISDEDEDHIDMGSVDSLSVKMLEDKAVLTCGNFQNITKTLKFEDDGFYVVDGNDIDNTLSYIVTQIDGVKYGAEINGSGPSDNAMIKKVDYVTAGWDDDSLDYEYRGEYATIEGYKNLARGVADHAEGYFTSAYGIDSTYSTRYVPAHAEGYLTNAYGPCAHAEGRESIALAVTFASHAEGFQTSAGDAGHSEGMVTAAGFRAHSEGYKTCAYGRGSHAEGEESISYGESSHAEGSNTYVDGTAAHAEGNYTLASGGYSHAEGSLTYTEGDCSHAEGKKTTAYNTYSHAEGYKTCSYGIASHSEGGYCNYTSDGGTFAIGENSHTEGLFTYALNEDCHAEGYSSTADSNYSHAEGYVTLAQGENSHSEGSHTYTRGDSSHAEGYYTSAEGDYSHSEGYCTCAYGKGAHSEGGYTTSYLNKGTFAIGDNSHSEGYETTAYGKSSHAEGSNTYSNGEASHAEGFASITENNYSHAGGYKTTAYGLNSFVHGEGVKTSGDNQVALGKYNSPDSSYVFSIGGGTDDSHRSNIFSIDWSGRIKVNGQPFEPGGGGGGSYVLPIASNQELGGVKIASNCGLNIDSTTGYLTPDSQVLMFKDTDYVTAGKKTGSTLGANATAEGSSVVASGTKSHAEGANTSALMLASHAEGANTYVYGEYGHGEGYGTCVSGNSSHAEGINTYVYGNYSHAEGYQTYVASKVFSSFNPVDNAHAEGYGTTAGSSSSHAEGTNSHAKGGSSHAEGAGAYAADYASHAEGGSTTAFGYYSHAEGYYTYAIGTGSHTDGGYTTANGNYSHAAGYYTYALGDYQTTIGKYNENDTLGEYGFIVGNGADGAHKSNAFGVKWDGTVHCQGNISAPNVADYAEYFEWYDQNINNEERLGLFVTFDENDNSKIRIANSKDDYILGIVSSTPFVLGNGDFDIWNNKYLKDEYGRILFETQEEEDAEGNIINKEVPILNPDYDDALKYISRKDRPEWSPIGMLGVIITQDDGTCIPGKYCKVNDDGIATLQETYNKNENYYRVTERVNEHLIKVVFK